MKRVVLFAGFSIILLGCVPSKKFKELKAKYEKCQQSLDQLKTKALDCEESNNDLTSENERQKDKIKQLKNDTAELGQNYREMQTQYDKVMATNQVLEKKFQELQEEGSNENANLIADLEETRVELQNKEDQLNQLETKLNAKERALKKREQRVQELEDVIARKDKAVLALKKRIADALLNFKGKGLKVEQKNGRIYVSLEAKLLFPSGSTVVDEEGKKAVVKLAKALENEEDLDIVVEGHTDSDPINSSKHPKDNWELSVLRSTSVVNIMTANSSIDPKILSASGRSQYHPMSDTQKAPNRRIEVIITPNLDQLFEIISSEG